MEAKLLGIEGPLAGKSFPLPDGETSLGRDPGNSIVLKDQTVSRRHAKITVISGSATVEDLGSTAGTLLNDQPLTGIVTLRVGDQVRLGKSSFIFQPGQLNMGGVGVASKPSAERASTEMSSLERPFSSTGQNFGALADNPGCMPNVDQFLKDAQGCIGPFLKYLAVVVVVLVLAGIIGGGMLLVGALGGKAASVAKSRVDAVNDVEPGPPPQAAAGQNAPSGPPPRPMPPSARVSIKIIDAKIEWLARPGSDRKVPVLLVHWKNETGSAIQEVDADLGLVQVDGRPIANLYHQKIYSGPSIAPGAEHQDDSAREGFVLPAQVMPSEMNPGEKWPGGSAVAPPLVVPVEVK